MLFLNIDPDHMFCLFDLSVTAPCHISMWESCQLLWFRQLFWGRCCVSFQNSILLACHNCNIAEKVMIGYISNSKSHDSYMNLQVWVTIYLTILGDFVTKRLCHSITVFHRHDRINLSKSLNNAMNLHEIFWNIKNIGNLGKKSPVPYMTTKNSSVIVGSTRRTAVWRETTAHLSMKLTPLPSR